MAFGFDPSIILAQNFNPNEYARTLSDLASTGVQRQVHQATLADLMRKQGQEQRLADVLRQNADTPNAVGPALMRGGFGKQALDWMGQQADVSTRRAQGQSAEQDVLRKRIELLARPLRGGLKTQEDLDRTWDAWRASGLNDVEMMGVPKVFNEQTAPLFDRIASMGTPIAPQLSEGEQDARQARAEYERAKAAALRNGPKAPDADKVENLRLRNEKLRRETGTGGPNKLLTLDGYDQAPDFEVKPEVAEKLREAQGQTRTMIGNVDELSALFRQYGNKVLPGQARARMEAIARHLQLRAKGKTMFELGVIAGPDMELLNSVIPVPTGKQATIADFFSGGGDASETMERLRVMREQLGANFDSAAASRGYRKKARAAPAKASGATKTLSDAERAELEELEKEFGK